MSTFQFLLDSLAFCMHISSIVQREEIILGFLRETGEPRRSNTTKYSSDISMYDITLKYYTQKKSRRQTEIE
jgi:hypothetical protein